MGYRPEKFEQVDGQGQLPSHKHTHSLLGATVFSSLDAFRPYHMVKIKPGSQACTAFISPFGTFQYIRMPFGFANTGSVYSRMLDAFIKEVDMDFWTSYLNDILTYSGKPWVHFGHITHVVLGNTATWIKKKPCKTKLFQSKGEYLGHRISKGGIP